MFPADFAYVRATSVPHAIDLLAAAQADGEEAKLLAGGQSLLPMMKLRLATPELLIDIAGISDLAGVTSSAAGTTIKALTTYRALRRDPALTAAIPALADALAVLADPQVRARGTIGGAVAHGDPAADLPAVLLALDAHVEITASGGTRTTPLDDFLQGIYATDLAEDEILTAITLPAPPQPAESASDLLYPGQRALRQVGEAAKEPFGSPLSEAKGAFGRLPGEVVATGSAYEKFPHPASHLPLAGVCAVVTVENQLITSAKVAVTGIAPRPYRARHTERVLDGTAPAPDSLGAAAALVAEDVRPLSDQHASGPFRVHLAQVLTRRALTRALARAGAG